MENKSLKMLKCEHLSFDVHTISQIENFKVKHKDAVNLELYLKEFSPKDELHHRNRTYLVKGKDTGLAMGLFFQSYFTNLRFSNL